MVEKIIKFFLKSNYFIFPLFWVVGFIWSIIESFTYAGFLPGTRFFLLLAVLSGLLTGIARKKTLVRPGSRFYEILFSSNKFIFSILLITFSFVFLLEKIHYSNYVFSLIHLQPKLLVRPCFLTGLTLLLGFYYHQEKWFLGKVFKLKNSLEIFNLLFALLLLFFAVQCSIVFVSDFYKEEITAEERQKEIQYATREMNIYSWVEKWFPKMKEVVFWCNRNSNIENLTVFDPFLTWYTYEGLLRVYMTNCNLYYVATPKEAREFFQGKRTFKWFASFGGCDSKIPPPPDKYLTIDTVEYLKAVNNYFVCNSKEFLPGLFVFNGPIILK